jgi:hypothetical protein
MHEYGLILTLSLIKYQLQMSDWSKVKDRIAVIALTAEGLSNSVATPIKLVMVMSLICKLLKLYTNDNIH